MGDDSSDWMISRMELSRPPGVSISTTRAAAPASAARVIVFDR